MSIKNGRILAETTVSFKKKSVSQIDRKPYKIRFEFRKVQTSSVPVCRNPRQGSHRSVFPSPSLLCYLISVEFSK